MRYDFLDELRAELVQCSPSDPIQFCAAWFQFRLERERNQLKEQLNSLTPYTGTYPLQHPSNYHHHQLNHPNNNNNNNNNTNYPYPYPYHYPTHNNNYNYTNHYQHYPPNYYYQTNPTYPFNNNPYSLNNNSSNNPNNTNSNNTNSNNTNNNNSINNTQQQHQQQPIDPFQNTNYLHLPSPSFRPTNRAPSQSQSQPPPPPPPLPQQQHPQLPLPIQPAHSQIEDESDGTSSDDPGHLPIPAGYNFGRRVSVSAESLSPSTRTNGPVAPKVVRPKTAAQRKRIEASIKGNLLFRNLDQEQHEDVLNAMEEVHVTKGTEVIVQGAVGDFFYVVEEGTFDVYVRGPPTYTYVPPSSHQTQGTLTLGNAQQPPTAGTPGGLVMTNPFSGSNNPTGSPKDLAESIHRESTPFGTSITSIGTTLTHQAPPKKVNSYGPGGSFGELALMYNAPRAATVVTTSPAATLWALDRVTFRSILIEHTARKRKMYENFLSEVPILASLSPTEISKIADSLEERSFAEGVPVVNEGEVGREFFIIESGRAEVYKRKRNSCAHPNDLAANVEEELVGILGKGDHFGELALLHSAPRAATVRAAMGAGRLRVAALGEKAFTRLLGPVVDILARHAESHYGKTQLHPASHPAAEAGASASEVSSPRRPAPENLSSPRNTSVGLATPFPQVPSPAPNAPAINLNNEFAGWNGLNGPPLSQGPADP